jgi:hypothetical protein
MKKFLIFFCQSFFFLELLLFYVFYFYDMKPFWGFFGAIWGYLGLKSLGGNLKGIRKKTLNRVSHRTVAIEPMTRRRVKVVVILLI